MARLVLVDRIVIPAVVGVLLVGGIAGTALGCALALRSESTLRFMARMNRWVSTRAALAPLEASHSVERAPGPGGRRPLLAHPRAAGWAIAAASLLVSLAMIGLLISRLH